MSGPLVSTAWLAARLGDPKVAILDATWFLPGEDGDARAEFAAAHVPGAAFFDIDEIADHTSALPHMLPDAPTFAAAARDLGVRQDGDVVAYDRRGLFSAPRVWWTFRAMGHDRVYVLDGGWPKWLREGRPEETGWRERPRGDFEARARPELVRDLAAVRGAVEEGSEQLVDARPAGRFRGEAPEPRPGLRPGHMPGALNVPWASLVDEQGQLKPAPALAAAFASAGVRIDDPTVATCGSGVSAAVLALALAKMGAAEAALYDGSWAEWGGCADTPIVTGEGGPARERR